jgi:hypothetical protein
VSKHLYFGYSRRRRERAQKNILNEIIAENFPNLGKDIEIYVEEAQSTFNRRPEKNPLQSIL